MYLVLVLLVMLFVTSLVSPGLSLHHPLASLEKVHIMDPAPYGSSLGSTSLTLHTTSWNVLQRTKYHRTLSSGFASWFTYKNGPTGSCSTNLTENYGFFVNMAGAPSLHRGHLWCFWHAKRLTTNTGVLSCSQRRCQAQLAIGSYKAPTLKHQAANAAAMLRRLLRGSEYLIR